jgi:hypothetical protein
MNEASENDVKRTGDPVHHRSDSFVRQPRRIAIAFTIIVITVMLALGAFIIWEYRNLQIRSNGEIGSVNIDTLPALYALTQASRHDGGGIDIETAF